MCDLSYVFDYYYYYCYDYLEQTAFIYAQRTKIRDRIQVESNAKDEYAVMCRYFLLVARYKTGEYMALIKFNTRIWIIIMSS